MKTITFVITALLLWSCSSPPIYYTYGDVTITRVEKGTTNYFYYGKHPEGKYPDSFIQSTYSGFNSGMGVYITFLPNKKVRFDYEISLVEEIGNDTNIYVNNNLSDRLPFYDDRTLPLNNTVFTTDILRSEGLKGEINYNKKWGSKVTATYPSDYP